MPPSASTRVLCGRAAVLAVLACGPIPAFARAAPSAAPWFVDVAAVSGLEFRHQPGLTGRLHLPEIMGPGCALADLDGDGDLDAYLVQGGRLEAASGAAVRGPIADRVYRNELGAAGPAVGQVRFRDVTAEWLPAGLTGGYGMGVAVGDVDGDGHLDVLLPRYGDDLMLRGLGGGRLADVTSPAGVSDPGWSVAASLVDLDRDGDLDAYVVDYLAYRPVRCALASGRPDYCGPKSFAPAGDRVLIVGSDLRFRDDSQTWLGARPRLGPGLGVISLDANGDGWQDLYVANDGAENDLWLNERGKRLREDGMLAGLALDRGGRAQASMGLVLGDVDGDGDGDLLSTHLSGETNTLWTAIGDGLFEDRTAATGIGAPSLPWTAFGAAFADFDLDGDLDLVTVNGAVHLPDRVIPEGEVLAALAQPGQLVINDGGRFRDGATVAGEALTASYPGRGLAVGDVDNDGDPDLLVAVLGGTPRLLLNRAGDGRRWLGVRVVDGRRDALGASVILRRPEGDVWRRVQTDGSYASAGDPRVVFALGDGRPTALDVTWSDGVGERFAVPPAGRYSTLRRGDGAPPADGGPR